MGLQDSMVGVTVPVTDMATAKEFYEGKLGLTGGTQRGDGGVTYEFAGGSRLHVYPSPDNAGKSGATIAAFRTDDVEGTVNELSSKGIEFEQYDMDQIKTNEKGIADLGDVKVAWFKDPDGNTLGVANG
jgi:catechol 2,3-dioxygenase-like lactoylglutathione lyase family enzyme